jgi:hypothetical protein
MDAHAAGQTFQKTLYMEQEVSIERVSSEPVELVYQTGAGEVAVSMALVSAISACSVSISSAGIIRLRPRQMLT